MDLTKFEALSFDCYGTLIDWEAGIAAVPAVNGRQEKRPDPRASADLAGDRSCCSSRKTPDGPVGVIACKA